MVYPSPDCEGLTTSSVEIEKAGYVALRRLDVGHLDVDIRVSGFILSYLFGNLALGCHRVKNTSHDLSSPPEMIDHLIQLPHT